MHALVDRSRGISLAELGFSDIGLDSGFEDCSARKVGGKPAFHDAEGRPLVDKEKFPSGLEALVAEGHRLNLTVSWYGNACACDSENSYTSKTEPTVAEAYAGWHLTQTVTLPVTVTVTPGLTLCRYNSGHNGVQI